ncbi:hypothetical protein A9Q74_13005 [Colwellia sp. 39_35_sub15_T18]|nr:hypothetical protein A9Q74_13005 [Colwellia sp. 39_35_sub15_T18]
MTKKIILTKELLEENLTGRSGFKKKQALALGEKYPLKTGWKKRIINNEFTAQQISRFISAGKNKKTKDKIKITKSLKQNNKIKIDNNTPFGKAVSLACWLIKDQNKSLKSTIQIVSRKYEYPNKDEIQEAVIAKLPKGEFEKAIGKKTVLKDAIDDAVWLVNNTKFTLSNIINKIADKHAYKPKSHIEKGIRDSFSDDYFKSRAKIPKGSVIGTSTQERAIENWQQNKHIKSIMED